MPKNITRTKDNSGKIVVARPSAKFRIGTRSSGKNAHTMSTDALREVLAVSDKKGDHQNAKIVLRSRGEL